MELELQNYRLTFEEEYLKGMKSKLDEALELARHTNSFGTSSELLILNGFMKLENQDRMGALDALNKAKELCEEKGFVVRMKYIEKHIERIEQMVDSSSETSSETIEHKIKRLHKYIEECQRLVLARK